MNIIFDLGGVVVTWEPEALVAAMFSDPADRRAVLTGIIGHADWVALDRGTLNPQDAVRRAAERTGLSEGRVSQFLTAVPSILLPNPKTIDLLYRLKDRGHALFCLSNLHVASIEHLEKTCTFWNAFSGIAISCRLHLCKPELAIYRHLLEEYGLNAEQTLFVDDVDANLAPAALLGMRVLKFDHPMQCEARLMAMGCL